MRGSPARAPWQGPCAWERGLSVPHRYSRSLPWGHSSLLSGEKLHQGCPAARPNGSVLVWLTLTLGVPGLWGPGWQELEQLWLQPSAHQKDTPQPSSWPHGSPSGFPKAFAKGSRAGPSLLSGKVRLSPPERYRCLEPDTALKWGAVLCTLGCLAAPPTTY